MWKQCEFFDQRKYSEKSKWKHGVMILNMEFSIITLWWKPRELFGH